MDSIHTIARNGDIHRAVQSGEYALSEVAGEPGDVLCGRRAGRTSDEQVTVAKLVRLGVQDLVAAEIARSRLSV